MSLNPILDSSVILNKQAFFYFFSNKCFEQNISYIGGKITTGYGEIEKVICEEINITLDGDSYLLLSDLFIDNDLNLENIF